MIRQRPAECVPTAMFFVGGRTPAWTEMDDPISVMEVQIGPAITVGPATVHQIGRAMVDRIGQADNKMARTAVAKTKAARRFRPYPWRWLRLSYR